MFDFFIKIKIATQNAKVLIKSAILNFLAQTETLLFERFFLIKVVFHNSWTKQIHRLYTVAMTTK